MLRSRDEDFLEPAEQNSVKDAVQALIAQALSVETEGKSMPVEVNQIRFLPIELQALEASDTHVRVSLWTGRLSAYVHFRAESRLDRADLRWSLFNNAVIPARAAIHSDGVCTEFEFSTYHPSHEWRRGS